MATNPIQRKSRISFLLGMLLMLIISAIIIVLLYMKINNQKDEIASFKPVIKNSNGVDQGIYVLNQDVVSGQVLTSDMFKKIYISAVELDMSNTKQEVTIPTSAKPSNSTSNIIETLNSFSLATLDGKEIYTGSDEQGKYYYCTIDKNGNKVTEDDEKHTIYCLDIEGNDQIARYLTVGNSTEKYFYYNDNNKVEITVASNAVIAKVDLTANTIITNSLITRADEKASNDLRKVEYNVFSLPVDLNPGEYIDVRLDLPTGESYIVLSKKQVTIPVVNGTYLADTIQMNLTEEEFLITSGAIVESYNIDGAKLSATRYIEAGLQSAAKMTYYPNTDVQELIQNDPNVVLKAIQGIIEKREAIRSGIDSAKSDNQADDDAVSSNVEKSITTTLEDREKYLQSLTAVVQ